MWTLVGVVAAFTGALTSAQLYGDDALRSKLLTEAPEAWKRIAELTNGIELHKSDDSKQGATGQRSDYHAKAAGGNRLVVSAGSTAEGIGAETVYCRNSRYSFSLMRRDSSSPWFVRFVGNTDSSQGSSVEQYFRNLPFDTFFKPQVSLGPTYLPEVLGKPYFVIKRVESVVRDLQTLVSVSFENSPPEQERPIRWAASGNFTLNPAWSWAIVDYEIDLQYRGNGPRLHHRLHKTYDVRSDGLPMPTGVRGEITTPGQPPKALESQYNVSVREIPESEFTLSAFGLPEIGQGSSHLGLRTYLVVSGAIILCIAVALLLWNRRAQIARRSKESVA